MSPKAVNYSANSIVFFKGDINERIYILKSGKVSLKYNDIETGKEINELIKTGEFFGVKSALGRYPREETAIVLMDSAMVTFSVPEFEQLVLLNTRIIMKMLKVFSNQLRRIHKQVRNLLSTGEQVNPETGLFEIGEYYLKSRKFNQAAYAFRRYLTYYPSGRFASQAAELVQQAEQGVSSEPHAAPGAPAAAAPHPIAGGETKGKELSDIAKKYYNSVSLFSQQKYREAYKEFQLIINGGQDAEYTAKSLFEMGRCLFSLNEYEKCVQHFTHMIQKYPKHPDLVEALYYVGSCHQMSGDKGKAEGFYKKIVAMSSDDMPVNRKAKKALRSLSGS